MLSEGLWFPIAATHYRHTHAHTRSHTHTRSHMLTHAQTPPPGSNQALAFKNPLICIYTPNYRYE